MTKPEADVLLGERRNVPLCSTAARDVTDRLRAEIVATSRRHGRVIDRDGLSIHSLGTAAAIALENGLAGDDAPRHVGRMISTIHRSDDALPLALGALPFDSSSSTTLVVPAATLVERAGLPPEVVLVAPEQSDASEILARELTRHREDPSPAPDRFDLRSARSHRDFLELVERAVTAIEAHELEKVVLAREVLVEANRAFRREELVERLRALYPSCTTFSLDGFVGASPELIVRKSGPHLLSHPLAGTVARSGDPDEDARLANTLLSSEKERAEHRFVVNAIVSGLRTSGARVDAPRAPELLELRNVCHLATTITAELDAAANVLDILNELHPTPAVAGVPRSVACNWIAEHEPVSRDSYAGPVGYIDVHGDGEWWLGIRSAMISGNSARLIAGVGIVEQSDPATELAETQLKLQALLSAAVRP